MSEEAIPLDKLALIYRKIRDKIALLTKEYDTQVEALKGQQDQIKFAMKDQMKALGVKSVRTDMGKRIAQLNMAHFLEENPTVVPPGLNSSTEYDITVTKPR